MVYLMLKLVLKKLKRVLLPSTQISVDLLTSTLGAKYTGNPIADDEELILPSKWKQLQPLFLIFSYVIIGSLMLTKGDSIALL